MQYETPKNKTPMHLLDAYKKELTTTVKNAQDKPDSNNQFITLDDTIFYPQSGGQPFDTGTLEIEKDETHYTYKVIFVGKFNGQISHEVEIKDQPKIEKGSKVTCKLDWSRRYFFMREHTAAHIVARCFELDLNTKITGNQLSEEKVRMDFNIENFDKEKMLKALDDANEVIQKDLKTKVSFMQNEDAKKDETLFKLASNLPDHEELRIVEIGDFDRQADGGTHVASTKEIGKIEFMKADNRGKNNRRVYFKVTK